ncbi:MAG: OmpA family protein [Agriterribacter sp.]
MKSLLIITGIILLSFQINRIIVNNSEAVSTASEVKVLGDKYITREDLPEIAPVYRSAKSIKNEASVAENAAIKTVAVVKVEKSVATNIKQSLSSKEHNNNFRMLHRLIKQSGNYLALSTVQFNSNEHNALDSESFQSVMAFADKLVFDETLKVSIAGFTDNKGTAEYNEQLSLLRAEDVRKYFVELGVKENQIMISANGVFDPVASNSTIEGRAQNRRVEMVLIQ